MEIDNNSTALLIVDVQNDFMPGGALGVNEGDQVVEVINRLQKKFSMVIATQDYHPSDHGSFAANHPGTRPGEIIELSGLSQILWPMHCVKGSKGAEFHPKLNSDRWSAVIRKGKNPEVDSYSGFFDNARRENTGLDGYLKSIGIKRLFICGLALDYCVKFTALDAKSLDLDTIVITDATKAVNLSPEDGENAIQEMVQEGIKIMTSKEL